MPDARRIYRLLLKLYPARFREEFERPLERQFWDDYRDARGFFGKTWFWMTALSDLAFAVPLELFRELRQDAAFALRIYRRRPFVTAIAVLALALAIGASTGVFSVVNTLLLRSLPFRDPDRLVELFLPPIDDINNSASLTAFAGRSPYLMSVAVYCSTEVNLAEGDHALRIKLAETSPTFFDVLGVEPVIGRTFTAANEKAVILSHGLWQAMFGGNPSVLGSTIHLNGVPMNVIGVAPAGMDFPARAAAWSPTYYDPTLAFKSGVIFPLYVGRLKPGVSMSRAAAIFRGEAERAEAGVLQQPFATRPRLAPIRDQLAGDVRQASLVLLGVVGFVLLIACANIAHLMLSRVTERRQELEIRAALGASRARLVQQLITECTLLTASAAAGGVVVAVWTSRLAGAIQPTQLSSQEYTILDWRVAGFAIGLAALTGLFFGVLPARLIGQPQTNAGRARHRLRMLLVGLQAALALVLVAGASSMGRSFLKLVGEDLGFRTGHVITMNVALAGTPHQKAKGNYYREALARLREIPGVESAGAVDTVPLSLKFSFMGFPFQLEGTPGERKAVLLAATSGYFSTIGAGLVDGRDFREDDRESVIVSEAFARGFPGVRLVGRTFLMRTGREPLRMTVAGIVKDHAFAPGGPRGAYVYRPVARTLSESVTFLARVRGDTAAYGPICRDALLSVDPKAPVFNIKTLDQRLADVLERPRFYTAVVLFFGAFALLLALTGTYGVATFLVVQQTHEIGVRLAVGASPQGLRARMLRRNLIPVVAGIMAGAWGAVQLGRVLESLFWQAEPIGPAVSIVAGVLLLATATVAIWRATKRIVLVDPARVLRAE